MRTIRLSVIACAATVSLAGGSRGEELGAQQILQKALEVDSFGLGDAEFSARALVKDARGGTRELSFSGRSRRYDGTLTKGLVRFSAPADLSGVAFLQIQKKDGDDDRFLYLPELHRARRIAGNTRSSAFMSTDFSYADLDRRDLRDATATAAGDENIGKLACYKLVIVPRAKDATYARFELWARKDNFVPLKLTMYNQAGLLLKTLKTEEVRRVAGRWFITRSLMTNHPEGRSTELVIDKLTPQTNISDDEFTVRNLEKG
jgi:outer membrane lipoprotein-sorting protein